MTISRMQKIMTAIARKPIIVEPGTCTWGVAAESALTLAREVLPDCTEEEIYEAAVRLDQKSKAEVEILNAISRVLARFAEPEQPEETLWKIMNRAVAAGDPDAIMLRGLARLKTI